MVGIFETGGDVHESEIWADAEAAMSAFRRTGYQSVTARLADGSDAGFTAFKEQVSRDPALLAQRAARARVLRQAGQGALEPDQHPRLHRGRLHGVGAMFGALNCMYSAIASRQVEIATLRAIGFGGTPVVVSVMIEALLLALLGGAVGGGAGLPLLRRRVAVHAQLQYVLAGGVRFPGDAGPAGAGPLVGVAIGVAGGLLPAIRAARLPVTVALRAA